MHIMRQIFCDLLLFLALGLCFRSSGAEEFTATANYTPTQPNVHNVSELQTDLASYLSQTILVSITLEDPTTVITTPLNPTIEPTTPDYTPDSEIQTTMGPTSVDPTIGKTSTLNPTTEQATPESDSETTAQIEQTTMTMTTVTELKSPEAPTTVQHFGLGEPKMTSPSKRPTDLITTATLATTTVSTEAPSTTNQMTDDSVDISTTISTETSTSQLIEDYVDSENAINNNLALDPADFTTVATSVRVEMTKHPEETNWLLILVVCVIAACVLCVIVILFIQKRKKSASQAFGPVYMNGQSKRSKKKKGAEDDAWAGPVNLETGAECGADVQEGLLPNNGKQDGEDVVLSTFALLDEDGMSNDGGVGGEGTEEAKKWEEQEPMPFIDEDVDENKMGKTLAENKRLEGDGKSEENMNGGETFCLTTAV